MKTERGNNHNQLISSFALGKVEEEIEGSPLNFLVHKNVMGKVPIVGRNNRNCTHNVLLHQKNLKGWLLFPLLPSIIRLIEIKIGTFKRYQPM